MERLKQLRKEIEEINVTYDLEETYYKLLNATIDYQNETQNWKFEYIFEDYLDDELLKYQVEYNLKEHGVWAVRNLLDNIKEECGIYRINAYGYGLDITKGDLEDIKEEILQVIDNLESGEE